jgi:ABC-type multidrug transport system ATPase subunit
LEIAMFAAPGCAGLSSGQGQRLCMGGAVLQDRGVMILDEPPPGIDMRGTWDLMVFFAARRAAGRSILFSTHILSEAERLCDRIGVIHRGLLLAAGTLPELCARTGRDYLDEVFRALVEEAA